MKKITVLGAGLVGKAIAVDMAKKYSVTSVDMDSDKLQFPSPQIKTRQADLSNAERIHEIIADADLVIGAVPGFMGFAMLKTVIEANKNIVDISFGSENTLALDSLAQKHNVIAAVDCGVAPGITNLVAGYHAARMNVERYKACVGGLPQERRWPFEYKAPFSPIDVIEEYTRPARFVENGQIVTKSALTDPEIMHFEKIGTLEAFNSDGLRTLLETVNIPNMVEKTLRYPGHRELMSILKKSGFFDTEPVNIKGHYISPIDLTSRLLIKEWELNPQDREFTIMRIEVKGDQKTVTYDLLDWYDEDTQTSSMARTTGYTCTAVAELVLNKKWTTPGIAPMEKIGEDEECFQFIFQHLQERGVEYKIRQEQDDF